MAVTQVGTIDGRLGCSTISFRALPLADALARISGLGFGEVDLGALPGTCDHVPTPLPAERVDVIAQQVRDSGLAVRLINADVADMDDPDLDEPELRRRLATLVELATAVDTSTILLPSGRKGTTPRTELRRDVATVARTITAAAGIVGEAGLSLLVEAPYSNRLCSDLDRAEMLYRALDSTTLGGAPVGAVLDLSHVVAVGDDPVDAVARLGDRIRHVHLRDATAGRINVSIGRGAVDFPAAIGALTAAGYPGHYSLELETRDIDDADRPAETARAAHYISSLLHRRGELPCPSPT